MAKPYYRVRKYRSAARPQLKALVVWNDNAGKRQRKFFNTLKEAETFAQHRQTELLNQGREVVEFSAALRVMAQEGAEKLRPFGRTLAEAVDWYVAELQLQQANATVANVYEEFYTSKVAKGLCKESLAHIRINLGRFKDAHAETLVSHVSAHQCREWLNSRGLGAKAINSALVQLMGFFRFAIDHGYCKTNPARAVEFAREIENEIGILTVEELSRLLSAADPEMLAFLAIGAFAGLRSSEIKRLDWAEIDLDEGLIEIKARKTKTGTRRFVRILPALRVWLAPIAKDKGPVLTGCAQSLYNRLYHLRQRAGLSEWPKNALRHSYASYHFAHFRNASELSAEMGHVGQGMIFRHYRQLVKPAEAVRFWNIMPDAPDKVRELAEANTVAYDPGANRERAEAGTFLPSYPVASYQRTRAEYVKEYGVSEKVVCKWMRHGMPLDDRAAMKAVQRGEYQHGREHYATLYATTPNQIGLWMRFRWPLDSVEQMQAFLAAKRATSTRRFPGARNRAVVNVIAMPTLRERRELEAASA